MFAGTPGGIVHEIGFGVSVLAWVAACLVLARRFAADRRRGWAVGCVGVVVATVLVAAWPHLDSLSVRLVVASALVITFFLSRARLAAQIERLGRQVFPAAARRSGPPSPPSTASPAGSAATPTGR